MAYTIISRPKPWWQRPLVWQPAVLLLLGLLIYHPTWRYQFTNWDDIPYLSANPHTQEFSLAHLRAIFTPGTIFDETLYIPFTYLSFLLENTLFGVSPVVVHVTNLLLHLLNTWLVFCLVRRIAEDYPPVAFLAALAFMVHPLQVETVAWGTGRKDLLSTAFALLALLAWCRYLDRPGLPWASATWLAVAGALLSKPTMLVLPGLLWLVLVYRKRTWRVFDVRAFLPLIALTALVYWLNIQVHLPTAPPPPLAWRLEVVPWVLSGWLRRFLLIGWPCAFYRWPDPDDAAAVLSAGLATVLGGALVLGLAWRLGGRALVAGLVFFGVAFAPALSLVVAHRDFVTADHYGYFPMVGLFFAVAMLPTLAGEMGERILQYTLVVWLAASTVLSVFLVPNWETSYTLWTSVIRQDPLVTQAHYNLAKAYESEPNFTPAHGAYAVAAYETTLRTDPTYYQAEYNLANLLVRLQQDDLASPHYLAAIKLHPAYVEAMVNLGNLFLAHGLYPAAEEQYLHALQYETPFEPGIHANLTRVYLALKQEDQARQHFARAQLAPAAWDKLRAEPILSPRPLLPPEALHLPGDLPPPEPIKLPALPPMTIAVPPAPAVP